MQSNCSGNFCKTYNIYHTLSRHSPIMINQWRIAYAHNKYLEQRYFSYIHYLWSRYFNTALATYVWTLGWIVQSLESSLVSCCSQCHYHHCCCCCSRTRNSGTPWKSPKECLFLSSDALPLIFLSLWHILYFLSFPCGQILFHRCFTTRVIYNCDVKYWLWTKISTPQNKAARYF